MLVPGRVGRFECLEEEPETSDIADPPRVVMSSCKHWDAAMIVLKRKLKEDGLGVGNIMVGECGASAGATSSRGRVRGKGLFMLDFEFIDKLHLSAF